MLTPVQTAQTVSQVSQYGRLAAAGARGVSTVDRSTQVEESSQHYAYNPDDDGILFNAYVDGKNKRQPGQGNPGEQKDQRAEQRHLSAARRSSDREGAVDAATDQDFASMLDPSIPFDLSANSGTSFYALVNAVAHGYGMRGTRLDASV
ncbi:hypothetical protein [Thalassospira sp. CH_XMU1448-2]|uniref:hypothetical protein n=1 Tax=Thalassospira sp. CH_XMU1448-2 TaxID=3107773 RepID=UPI00300A1F22